MAGFADLIRIWPCLNVIGLPRFDGHGQRTTYWIFEQRLEERFALFQVRLQLGKGSNGTRCGCRVRTVGAASDATTTISSGALKDALI